MTDTLASTDRLARGVYPMDRHMILGGVVGSTAYGLATATSDEDHLGVFIAPRADVLGLRGHAATTESIVRHDPEDVAVHEIGKFLAQCLKGNPTVMELLWLDAYEVCTPEGEALIGLRTAVLSEAAVRDAFGGYATQQARRLLNRHEAGKEGFSADVAKRTSKHGRHCMRLLIMGRELVETGELVLDMSARRDMLFAAGDLAVRDPEAFCALFESELAALDAVTGVLPEQPDIARVQATLVALREQGA